MSDTRVTLTATGGTLLAVIGALVVGAGLAGAITTATIDLAAFGSFAGFVQLATPYAYAGAAALVLFGLFFIVTGNALRRGRAFTAGLVATALLAAVGLAAFLFADRIPFGAAVLAARVAGVALLLPFLSLIFAYPGPARR